MAGRVGGVIGVAAVVASVFVCSTSAGAAVARPSPGVAASAGRSSLGASTVAGDRIVIGKKSGLATFRPKTVSGPSLWDGSGECTAAIAAFIIHNKTSAHQQVDIVGSGESLQVDADSSLPVCGYDESSTYPYQVTFKIFGGKGKLIATFDAP